jgi:biopolymer transport protein ExbD
VTAEANMAGIDVGSSGAKRATNSDINMIPFIDLLMVTIAFLLITAVWVTNSRLEASAQVPGTEQGPHIPPPEKVLNVHVGESDFDLIWKHGSTVVSQVKVPKSAVEVGEGSNQSFRYPDLAKRAEAEWALQGGHKDPSDRKVDQVILHSDNRTSFKEIIAVMDALNAPKRDMKLDGKVQKVPVFSMTFSAR